MQTSARPGSRIATVGFTAMLMFGCAGSASDDAAPSAEPEAADVTASPTVVPTVEVESTDTASPTAVPTVEVESTDTASPTAVPTDEATSDRDGELDLGSASRLIASRSQRGTPLADLVVEGDGIEVFPEFGPDTLRYAVRLGDDTELVTIRPVANEGDVVLHNGLVQPGGSALVVAELPEDRITTTTFTVDDAVQGPRQYEVVIVPRDYPVNITDLGSPHTTDWALYVSTNGPNRDAYVIKSDMNGVPYFWHVHRSDRPPAGRGRAGRLNDFKPHPNGLYSYTEVGDVNEFDRRNHDIVLLDERYEEIERLRATGDGINHSGFHDFKILANGNYAFVAYNGMERNGVLHEDSIVVVIDPATGDEVLRWNSWDHLDLIEDDLVERLPDYAHINSVFEDEAGDLYLSLRWTSSIIKIDGETGEVIWTLGGYRNDFEVDDRWGGTCGQHTPQIASNGNLIVFDNGVPCLDTPGMEARPNPRQMRYVEYELDELAMTATVVREIVQPDYATGPTGSVQELPDGHVLVSWGFPAADYSDFSIDEYDADDNLVRTINLAGGDQVTFSYRAYLFKERDYATAVEDGGASHVIGSRLRLGATIGDAEAPDDGVVFPSLMTSGESASVVIEASAPGLVSGWIDFNADGDWTDAGDQIFADLQVDAGSTTVPISIPEPASSGLTFSRVRFSTTAGLGPTGPAPDGEVEDYQVHIVQPEN